MSVRLRELKVSPPRGSKLTVQRRRSDSPRPGRRGWEADLGVRQSVHPKPRRLASHILEYQLRMLQLPDLRLLALRRSLRPRMAMQLPALPGVMSPLVLPWLLAVPRRMLQGRDLHLRL
jgi:hypothetical protein